MVSDTYPNFISCFFRLHCRTGSSISKSLALFPSHLVSCRHITSILRVFIRSANFLLFPVIVPIFSDAILKLCLHVRIFITGLACFPVFADFSNSSTSNRSISGSCSRMFCAKKLLNLVASLGFSSPSK